MNPYNKKVGFLVLFTIALLGYFYFVNRPKNVTINIPPAAASKPYQEPEQRK